MVGLAVQSPGAFTTEVAGVLVPPAAAIPQRDCVCLRRTYQTDLREAVL